MNFAGNFRRIGSVDVEPLRALVARLGESDWNEFPVRQQRYEVHRDTQMIALVYDPDFRHTHPTRLPALETFLPALRPALATIADYYETDRYEKGEPGRAAAGQNGLGYFIRATLVRLGAGSGIPEHQDLNFSLTHSHRVHLPIVTNDAVRFSVGRETICMQAGEIREINNRRPHSVRNDGAAGRIHAILDFVLPGEQCCCGRKRHPGTRCSPQACMDTVRLRVPCTCFPET